MIAPGAADEGERDAARNERIGDAACRFAPEMGIEQRALHGFTGDGVERIGDIRGRADHGEARPLKHTGNIECDEELVFNHEDTRCCHSAWRLSVEAKSGDR